jgi:Beta-propeller repeat
VSKSSSSSNWSSNSSASSSRKWMRGVGTAAGVVIIAIVALAWSPSRQHAADSSSSGATHSVASSPVPPQTKAGSLLAQARLRASFAALPLAFEQNQGQVDSQVKYMARGDGYKLFLTSSDAVLTLKPSASRRISKPRLTMEQRLLGYSRQTHKVIRVKSRPESSNHSSSMAAITMHVVNGNAGAKIEGRGEVAGKVNYFIGNDPKKWHANVPEFESVSYAGIYPGIDLVYHGEQKQLEFDFVVAPLAKAENIALNFAGVQRMTTDRSGNLVLTSASGDLTLHRPVAYQPGADGHKIVDAHFVIAANHQVGFALGDYDHSRELVIDPMLSYATYIGGNGDDEAYGVASDSSGNFYITGESDSTSGFPGSNPIAGGYDSFVVKINSNGSLGYTTFIGGSGDDLGSAIAVDFARDVAYVAGITTSTDLPVTAGVVQSTPGSPAGSNCTTASTTSAPCTDGFVFELGVSGAPAYVTYLGGNNDDGAFGIAIDGDGNAYVTGFTYSANFPLQSQLSQGGALNDGQSSNPPFEDAFVTEIILAQTHLFIQLISEARTTTSVRESRYLGASPSSLEAQVLSTFLSLLVLIKQLVEQTASAMPTEAVTFSLMFS